ncbi:unnamed protein product, partial [Symbiodinium pilosum]
ALPLVSAIRAKHPNWLLLSATWLQAMGCVRLTIVQRSRLVSMGDFGDAFVRAMSALPRKTHPQSIAFDLATGTE